MADIINTLIPDFETSWENYAGTSVEEFIKRYLKDHKDNKIGYFSQPEKGSDDQYHMLAFASIEDYEEWMGDPTKTNLILENIVLPAAGGGGGGATVTTLKLELVDTPSTIVSIDGMVSASIRFTSTLKEADAAPVDNPVTGTLNIYGRTSSNSSWVLKASKNINSASIDDENDYETYDISEYVDADVVGYQMRFIVNVNNDDMQASSNAVQISSITKTTLSIEFAGNWERPIIGMKDGSDTDHNTYLFRYYIGGAVGKDLHIQISTSTGDMDSPSSTASTKEITVIGLGTTSYLETPYIYTYTEPSNESQKKFLLSHGVHTITAWLSVSGDPSKESARVVNQVMVQRNYDDNDESQYDGVPRLLIQNCVSQASNYVATDFFRYALYCGPTSSDEGYVRFAFGNSTGSTEYLTFEQTAAQSLTKYTFNNTLEIEEKVLKTIQTYLRATDIEGSNMLSGFTGNRIPVVVDNLEDFTPTANASFILNPKSRSNSETAENRATIINAANGQPVSATFEGFNWTSDGWIKDTNSVTGSVGQTVLRVPSNRYVTIDYEPFGQYIGAEDSNSDVTIEVDFMVSNITDEDTPIFRICEEDANGNCTKGIQLKPLEGVFMTTSNTSEKQQNFAWQEDVRTHIAFNVVHNVRSLAGNSGEVPYGRVFINGVINREFKFNNSSANEFISSGGHGGIRIGAPDADIDIYSIRIYTGSYGGLSSRDVEQDYMSSLPSAIQKQAFKVANSITANGYINYSLAKEQYNCLLWHGYNVSNHSAATQQDQKGYLEVSIVNKNADGTYTQDKEHSGTLTELTMKGQGTTAKTYYEWNNQWQWKGETGGFTNLNGEEVGQKYAMTSDIPAAKKLVSKINYASSMQSHKAGATALYNDLYRRICLTSSDGNTVMKTNSKARVAVYELPFLYFVQTPEDAQPVFQGLCTFGPGKMDKPTWGYDKAMKLFGMFEGADNNNPLTDMRVPWDEEVTYNPDAECYYYNGLKNINFDAGNTWVNTSGEELPYPEELETEETIGTLSAERYIKNAWNWLYEHNCFIKPWEDTIANLRAWTEDPSQNTEYDPINTSYCYWMTNDSNDSEYIESPSSQYNLYRYNYAQRKWVRSTYRSVTGTATASVTWGGNTYNITRPVWGEWQEVKVNTRWNLTLSSSVETANNQIIGAIIEDFKTGNISQAKYGVALNVESFFVLNDLLFHHEFIKLIAGTDNRSKNTYYVVDPGTGKITLSQDDLDTIIRTNNVGWQSKPYWVEERDIMGRDNQGNPTGTHWEGQFNVLQDLIERAYGIGTGANQVTDRKANSRLQSMMSSILAGMTALATGGVETSVNGCCQKYFYNIQEYFPAIAFNETAKIRYETAQLATEQGTFDPPGIMPITQSLGDQLQAEKEFMKRRLIYLSSYCTYGEFSGAAASGSLSVRTGQMPSGLSNLEVVLNLVPHQWLYPSGGFGSSVVTDNVRLAPGGWRVDAQGMPIKIVGETENPLPFVIGTVSGDTTLALCGVNYYRKLGSFNRFITDPNATFTLNGKRLVEFDASGDGLVFRPTNINITENTKLIKVLDLSGVSSISGVGNFTEQYRLQKLDLRGTNLSQVNLPKTDTLTELYLPGTLTTLSLSDLPNITSFAFQAIDYTVGAETYSGYPNLTNLTINGRNLNEAVFSTYNIANNIYRDKTREGVPPLENCNLINVRWGSSTNKIVSTDVLCYYAKVGDSTLSARTTFSGKIYLHDNEANSTVGYRYLKWAEKIELINKYGDITDINNSLYVYHQIYSGGNNGWSPGVRGEISIPNFIYGNLLTTKTVGGVTKYIYQGGSIIPPTENYNDFDIIGGKPAITWSLLTEEDDDTSVYIHQDFEDSSSEYAPRVINSESGVTGANTATSISGLVTITDQQFLTMEFDSANVLNNPNFLESPDQQQRRFCLRVSIVRTDPSGNTPVENRTTKLDVIVGFFKRAPRVGDFAWNDGCCDDKYSTGKILTGVVFMSTKQNAGEGVEIYDVRVDAYNSIGSDYWGPGNNSGYDTIFATYVNSMYRLGLSDETISSSAATLDNAIYNGITPYRAGGGSVEVINSNLAGSSRTIGGSNWTMSASNMEMTDGDGNRVWLPNPNNVAYANPYTAGWLNAASNTNGTMTYATSIDVATKTKYRNPGQIATDTVADKVYKFFEYVLARTTITNPDSGAVQWISKDDTTAGREGEQGRWAEKYPFIKPSDDDTTDLWEENMASYYFKDMTPTTYTTQYQQSWPAAQLTNNGNAAYQFMFYPAFMKCRQWEPETGAGSNRSSFFKRGQWYLPDLGEICRQWWLNNNGTSRNDTYFNKNEMGNMRISTLEALPEPVRPIYHILVRRAQAVGSASVVGWGAHVTDRQWAFGEQAKSMCYSITYNMLVLIQHPGNYKSTQYLLRPVAAFYWRPEL